MAAESKKRASTKSAGKAGAKKATPPKPARERVIDAAFDLAAVEGWNRVSMSAVAAASGQRLDEVYRLFPTKAAILDAFLQRIDEAVLGEGPAEDDESVRDRLFDILMRRFDALTPYRSAIEAILHDMGDPNVWLTAVPGFLRSMAWTLEAAGLSSSGLRGLLRIKGLGLIALNGMRVWLRDDTPDQAKTMAAVDRGLRQAESLIALLRGRRAAGVEETPPAD